MAFIEKSASLDRLVEPAPGRCVGPSPTPRLAAQRRPPRSRWTSGSSTSTSNGSVRCSRRRPSAWRRRRSPAVWSGPTARSPAWSAVPPTDLVGVFYGSLTDDETERGGRRAGGDQQPARRPGGARARLARGHDERRVRATLAPVRDSSGRPLYLFLQVQDITAERAAAERAPRERGAVPAARRGGRGLRHLHARPDRPHRRAGTAAPSAARATRPRRSSASTSGSSTRPRPARAGTPSTSWRSRCARATTRRRGGVSARTAPASGPTSLITAVFNKAGEHVGFAKVTRDNTRAAAAGAGARDGCPGLGGRQRGAGAAQPAAAAGSGRPGAVPGRHRPRAAQPHRRARRLCRDAVHGTGRSSTTRSGGTCSPR